MGGKALKTVTTRRYTKAEIEEVINELIPLLELTASNVYAVKSFNQKETFGDLDILVEITGDRKQTIDGIFSTITCTEKNSNSNCVSFDFYDLQVDLILVPPEEFEFAKLFYNYNDFGLIVGRLAKCIGLTFGFDGLYYKVRHDGHKLGKIALTKDPRQAMDVLGLDYDRWLQGFETIEDVFEFCSTTPFFNRRIIEPSFQNSEMNRRDNLRVNYHLFLDWMDRNADRFPAKIEKPSKEQIIEFYDHRFPFSFLESKYDALIEKYERSKKVAEKFNGRIIMEVTGLQEGAIIGKIIKNFKEMFYTHEAFQDFILNINQPSINEIISIISNRILYAG